MVDNKQVLNVHERIVLYGILPAEGNVVTAKVVRKLKEALTLTDEETKSIDLRHGYKCPYRGADHSHCEVGGFFPEPAKCAIHDVYMEQTGAMVWNREKAEAITKTIYMNKVATSVVEFALKKLDNEEQINDLTLDLYERFLPPEEPDVPESIVKSMEE